LHFNTSEVSFVFPPAFLYKKIETLSQKLVFDKLTIATAESITGGLVAALLTSVPGSSRYFLAGFNTYSNDSKIKLLDIPKEIIRDYGAVSNECSIQMAKNVTKIIGSEIGVSTTGIAGPDGYTLTKPVGLVYFAAYWKNKGLITWEKRFSGSRHEITLLSAETALDILFEILFKY
jgi:PncC family amidohydrolase